MDIVGKYANVNGTRLYYEIVGSGQSLVLIHGFSLDCRQWKDQLEFFSKYFKVIAYDLRGFGSLLLLKDLIRMILIQKSCSLRLVKFG